MIERLEIRNFQVHKKLNIDLDPYITTICGETDAGKSAIIRALRWFVCNRPTGDRFIRRGTDSCKLLLFIDGHAVLRHKAKGKNTYSLDNQHTYRAVAATVPEAIDRILNLGEENFQGQLDKHFWFHLTPGQISKELNKIVNLADMDRTQANLAAMLRDARAGEKVCLERLQEARREQKRTVVAVRMNTDLNQLEKLQRRLSKREERLSVLISTTEKLSRQAKSLQRATDAIQIGQKLHEETKGFEDMLSKVKSLEKIVQDLEHSQEELKCLQNDLRTNTAKFQKMTQGKECPVCHQTIRSLKPM